MNNKKWHQVKERSAGQKRLKATWLIYKLFGRKPVGWIAWWVAFFTFIFSKSLRRYSKKYFEVLHLYTKNPQYKSTLKNCFLHTLSYANALVDKMEVYANSANFNFLLDDNSQQTDFSKNGAFLIFTHTGNIELLRAFLNKSKHKTINIFMQKAHCKKFNKFLNSLSENQSVTIFPVEDIGIETAIEIKNKLSNGEIVLMAGDRLSSTNENSYYTAKFLGEHVKFPVGTLKFALMMETPIYLIGCLKESEKQFKVIIEPFIADKNKHDNLEHLKKHFVNFFEKITLKKPYQFYHFYDFFE